MASNYQTGPVSRDRQSRPAATQPVRPIRAAIASQFARFVFDYRHDGLVQSPCPRLRKDYEESRSSETQNLARVLSVRAGSLRVPAISC